MPTTQNIQEIIEIIRSAGIYEGTDAALRLTVSFLASFPAESAPAEHAVLLAQKGKLLWRLGQRGEAISAYEQSARLDPDGPGTPLLEHSRAIMDFFNPDLLNP